MGDSKEKETRSEEKGRENGGREDQLLLLQQLLPLQQLLLLLQQLLGPFLVQKVIGRVHACEPVFLPYSDLHWQ